MLVLGISGLYHDSSAALLEDGEIIAAVQEERFTRVKNDASFPYNGIDYCLKYKGVSLKEIDAVVYYDNPILTLDRFVKNAVYCRNDVKDLLDFQFENMFENRLMIHKNLEKRYGQIGKENRLLISNHHKSHAASAFYASPYREAAILTIDGVGEWNTTTLGYGCNSEITMKKSIEYPHSLGLLYSAFTYFCGFKVNSGEYKLMGLAPYGSPVYYDAIMEELIDVKNDGSFRLNLDYFDFHYGREMVNDKFAKLFHLTRRMPESVIKKEYMDLAASVQKVTEEIVIKLSDTAVKLCNTKNLVMAGGTALNCVANGRILREGIVENLWVQPASGDSGGAIGAAYLGYYEYLKQERKIKKKFYNTYLGPSFSNEEIGLFLRENHLHAAKLQKEREQTIAKLLWDGKIIGLFDGRMEMGPRALGNRSIIARATDDEMQSKLNMKIKHRESFRPFAPSVLAEDAQEYFDIGVESPYMLLCAPVKENLRTDFNLKKSLEINGYDMVKVANVRRSAIPAVTHVDYSARVQTVSKDMNPRYYAIIEEYKKLSGVSVICNTSFNVRGEPIVCTPQDAYDCFMNTDMDVLILGDFILIKEEQPKRQGERREYEPD